MTMLRTGLFSTLQKKKRTVMISYAYARKKREALRFRMHIPEKAQAKDGKSTRTLKMAKVHAFQEKLLWLIFGDLGCFLEVVKGYKTRGDREKENTTQDTHIESV